MEERVPIDAELGAGKDVVEDRRCVVGGERSGRDEINIMVTFVSPLGLGFNKILSNKVVDQFLH